MLTLRSRFAFILLWLTTVAVARAVNPVLPTIPTNVFLVTDYGAVGNGVKDNTASLQKAIDAAKAAGGGIVEIPAGTFLSGPITLFSRMNLRVDGTLRMLPLGTYPGGYTDAQTFITADQAHDLELSGWGMIDGQGAAWWQAMRDRKSINRPMMLQFFLVPSTIHP